MADSVGIEPTQAVLETAVIPLDQSGVKQTGDPTGIRTPVTAVKGRRPRPLDDGDLQTLKQNDSRPAHRELSWYILFNVPYQLE